ncbi:MAG TPA: lipoyl(octanoyl) transferase LipB [Kofleriaceae bacterium]|nr:lipoyl(octanoyl) transferase LipB [Kofleriaceae bacterium]
MIEVVWRGRVAHADAVAEQEARRERILAGDASAAAVILCEHDPVITLGRNANRANVIAAGDVPVVEVSRGGDVTYHGPGQLMVYPIVRVRGGVVAFLEAIASALAEVAAQLGAPGAAWRRDPAGLWLADRKLAACGIHLRRSVAIHGWAFNVSTPPSAWRAIVPCGLGASPPPISIAEARGSAPAIAEVAALAAPILSRAIVTVGA